MAISELHKRLCYVKHGGVPLSLPQSGVRPSNRGAAPSGGVRGDLRITVRASPRVVPPPLKRSTAGAVAIGAGWDLCRTKFTTHFLRCSPDDQMSIAVSEGELSLSRDDDSAALPPSGVVALSKPDQG